MGHDFQGGPESKVLTGPGECQRISDGIWYTSYFFHPLKNFVLICMRGNMEIKATTWII